MIENILDEELKKKIIQTIRTQCFRFSKHWQEEEGLYYQPYMKARTQHTLTGAVLSGFASKNFSMPGITVIDLEYGQNHLYQPEIQSENAIIQIYNKSSGLTAKTIKEHCCQYNRDSATRPQFLLIVFDASEKNGLRKIEAQYLNADAELLERQDLYANITPISQVG